MVTRLYLLSVVNKEEKHVSFISLPPFPTLTTNGDTIFVSLWSQGPCYPYRSGHHHAIYVEPH